MALTTLSECRPERLDVYIDGAHIEWAEFEYIYEGKGWLEEPDPPTVHIKLANGQRIHVSTNNVKWTFDPGKPARLELFIG